MDSGDGESSPFELYEATNLLNQLLASEHIAREQKSFETGSESSPRREQSPRQKQERALPQSPLELFTPRPAAKTALGCGGESGESAASDLSASEMVRGTGEHTGSMQ